MIDVQKLFDSFNQMSRETRSQYHMTLGDLINVLVNAVNEDKSSLVLLDVGGFPGNLHSYRGYYSDLAFGWCKGELRRTSENLLVECRKVLNTELEGYKGGMYLMGPDTPLWISDYGEASGLAVVGVEINDLGNVKFLTKPIE